MKLYRKKYGSVTQVIEIVREDHTGVWFKFRDLSSGTEHFFTYEYLNYNYVPAKNFIFHPVGFGVHTIQVGDVFLHQRHLIRIKAIFVDTDGDLVVTYETARRDATPMLMHNTSNRKLEHLGHLFNNDQETTLQSLYKGETYVSSVVNMTANEVLYIGKQAVFFRDCITGAESSLSYQGFCENTISAEHGLGKRLMADLEANPKNRKSPIEY